MRRVRIALVSGREACRVLALLEVKKVGRSSLPTAQRASFGAVGPHGPEKQVECVPVGKHYGRQVGHFGWLRV